MKTDPPTDAPSGLRDAACSLLPCPFCGKAGKILHSRHVVCSDDHNIWRGENGCSAAMIGDDAVKKWNFRANSQAQE